MFKTIILTVLLPFFIGACSSIEGRSDLANELAEANGFKSAEIKGGSFVLAAFYKFKAPEQPLHVYIEGDGVAWVNRTQISGNPTPRNPIALRLAVRDSAPNVLYIARPCQYVSMAKNRRCNENYWTCDRFAPEVIRSVNDAVSLGKERANASGVHLFGYSGGGAVAVLVAAERNDVKSIRTAAGNLDHKLLNKKAKVSPLTGSLNPADVARDLKLIPQIHFAGAKDKTVPPFVSKSYLKKAGAGACIKTRIVQNTTHSKGWVKSWKRLLKMPLPSCD